MSVTGNDREFLKLGHFRNVQSQQCLRGTALSRVLVLSGVGLKWGGDNFNICMCRGSSLTVLSEEMILFFLVIGKMNMECRM